MRRLIAALVLVLALVSPLSATHRQEPVERLVAWTGCDATVVTSDERSAVESYFSPFTNTVYIGTGANSHAPAVPVDLALIIILHEAAHCLQWSEGVWFDTLVERELDADRRAADLACALGIDGARLLHDLFAWAYEVFGYEGDVDHGTMAQRISQSAGAPNCNLPLQQTPFQAV